MKTAIKLGLGALAVIGGLYIACKGISNFKNFEENMMFVRMASRGLYAIIIPH